MKIYFSDSEKNDLVLRAIRAVSIEIAKAHFNERVRSIVVERMENFAADNFFRLGEEEFKKLIVTAIQNHINRYEIRDFVDLVGDELRDLKHKKEQR